MRKPVLTLLAVPFVLVACSKVSTAPNAVQTTAPASVQTPKLPNSSGPSDTAAAAAPTNAKDACEYLTAAFDQLVSDDRSVDQAVSYVQSGADSALAATANDPAYGKLKTDIEAFLEEVVRLQVQRHVIGHTVTASKYPASYRETVTQVKADCS